jgi:TRAP-type C4-dicarboxylate transport system permease small subunit
LLYFFIWLPPVAWPLWAETNNESSIALISSVLGSLYVLALLVGAVLATLRLRRSLRSPAAQS